MTLVEKYIAEIIVAYKSAARTLFAENIYFQINVYV
jgi:hypothetical protein